MEFVQRSHVGCDQDVFQVYEVPLRIDQLGERVSQVELLEVVEVSENPAKKKQKIRIDLQALKTFLTFFKKSFVVYAKYQILWKKSETRQSRESLGNRSKSMLGDLSDSGLSKCGSFGLARARVKESDA